MTSTSIVHSHAPSLHLMDHHHSSHPDDEIHLSEVIPSAAPRNNDADADAAARVIQRRWRTRRTTVAPPQDADADAKWKEMCIQAEYEVGREAADQGKNDVRSRWRRAAFLAARLGDGEAVRNTTTRQTEAPNALHLPREPKSKILETQNWLELIDGKHRYGSNLKFYFRRWNMDDSTTDNFFHWLDRGAGKDLDLPECSRRQLDSERITYLSAEQRLNYIVEIDSRGLLRWARNGHFVDTAPHRWKDAQGGMGIVPLDGAEDRDVERRLRRKVSTLSGGVERDSSGSGTRSSEELAQHYTVDPTKNKPLRALTSRFTVRGLMEKFLRKIVKKNTWIYVTDMKFNIFVGIKTTGSFQHSSFTGGGRISSAGVIKVKDGQIQSLSPFSGHYQTTIEQFEAFLHVLEARGADLHKVHPTKGEALLWGLEKYGEFKKANSAFVQGKEDLIKSTITRRRASTGDHGAPSTARRHRHRRHEDDDEDEEGLSPTWRMDIILGRTVHRVSNVVKNSLGAKDDNPAQPGGGPHTADKHMQISSNDEGMMNGVAGP